MNAPVLFGESISSFGGSSTSCLTAAEKPQRWKLVKKLTVTRITVIRRFGRKYCTKSFQCSILPGLTVGPLQDQREKDNPSESVATKRQSAGSAPTSGVLFSPQYAPAQDAPQFKRFATSEKNGEGFVFNTQDVFKDHLALSPVQILLALFSFQMLTEADLLDESTAGLVVMVTVIILAPGLEGTTATNDRVMRNVPKGLLLLLCLSSFVISGVHAQDESEDGELECPNEQEELPHNVKAAAWTLLAGLFIAAGVAGRINRRRLVTETPATAAAPVAVPPPAAAAPAVPVPAAAPVAVPPPAAAPLAVPVPAAALNAVPPLAAAPLAMPAAAAAGFDIVGGLLRNPDAARRNDPTFDTPPHL